MAADLSGILPPYLYGLDASTIATARTPLMFVGSCASEAEVNVMTMLVTVGTLMGCEEVTI